MFQVVRYCVQPFVRQGGRVVRDDAQQFKSKSEAIRRARYMQRRVAGAAVYEVTGWPVQDMWNRPRLIIQYGETSDAT